MYVRKLRQEPHLWQHHIVIQPNILRYFLNCNNFKPIFFTPEFASIISVDNKIN